MWLFTRKRSTATLVAPPPIPDDRLALPDHGRVPVLGADDHQAELAVAADGGPHGQHPTTTAALVPEPGAAVRVDVLVGDRNLTVGALPEAIGAEYRDALARIGERGQVGTCPARITGGGDTPFGVYLLLAPPRDVEVVTGARDPMVAAETGGRVRLWGERTCSVTREEDHQDALAPHAPPAGRDTHQVHATLGFCDIDSGRYRGEQAIEVLLGGRRVGQLTYAMSVRYAQPVRKLLSTGVEVTCAAVTRRAHDGVRVDLLLPQLSD